MRNLRLKVINLFTHKGLYKDSKYVDSKTEAVLY